MKKSLSLSVLVASLFVGCEYESPLTTEHNIPVDPAVLGLWVPIRHEGSEPKQNQRWLVLKYWTPNT